MKFIDSGCWNSTHLFNNVAKCKVILCMIDLGGSQPAPRVMLHRLHLEVGLTLLKQKTLPGTGSCYSAPTVAIADVTFLWQLYDYSSPVIWGTLLFPAAVHEACQCSYCVRASIFQQFCWYLIKSGSFIVFQSHDCSLRFLLRDVGHVYRQVFGYGQQERTSMSMWWCTTQQPGGCVVHSLQSM